MKNTGTLRLLDGTSYEIGEDAISAIKEAIENKEAFIELPYGESDVIFLNTQHIVSLTWQENTLYTPKETL